MKQTRQSHDGTSQNKAAEKGCIVSKQPDPGPQGIGMAVAFDWGLAVQILVTPFLPLFLPNTGFFKAFKLNPALTTAVSFLISLPFVALLAIFGEGVRRGWRWTRPVQIVINSLGFLGGFTTLPGLWQGSKEGNYWSLVTAVILLIFSPLIAWRLSRPVTKQWFATVNSKDARRRHGGSWPWLILLWAIAGGVLQAIASAINSSR